MKNSKFSFKNLIEISQLSEEQCKEHLSEVHFQTQQNCPHCGCYDKFWFLKSVKRYKCSVCKKQFSVLKGTIFEASHIPLRKWFMAIFMLQTGKKGLSSYQLSRQISVTQSTAWFMLHRIRKAMNNNPEFKRKLKGIVEVDETYVGGKGKNKRYVRFKRGLGSENKIKVVGFVEREGIARCIVVKKVNKSLSTFAKVFTEPNTIVMTDDHKGYRQLHNKNREHYVINHSAKQYVDFDNPDIHTNTIEGFWSLLKRGVLGTYHKMTKKHMLKYCHEFMFRYNTRNSTISDVFHLLISQCINVRLRYSILTACINR